MSALSIQVPYQIFADSDGTPLDNGYVWIGTTNLDPRTYPINVYFDAALTQVAPNPLRTINGYVYNAGSPAQLYIDGVNFSIRVEDKKSFLVYSFPSGSGISPVSSSTLAAASGAGLVGFSRIGGRFRTLFDKGNEIATPDDFVGDEDTSRFLNALAYAKANKIGLILPKPFYDLDASAEINFAGVNLKGIGKPELRYFGTGRAFTIDAGAGDGTNIGNANVENLIIVGSSSITDGFYSKGAVRSVFRNIEVRECTNFAFNILHGVSNQYDSIKYSGNEVSQTVKPAKGLVLNNNGAGYYTADCTFINTIMEGLPGIGCEILDGSGNTFVGGTFEGLTIGFRTEANSDRNHFIGIWCEINSTRDLEIYGVGNTFDDCNFQSSSPGPNVEVVTGQGSIFRGGYIRTANLQSSSRDTLFVGCGFDQNLTGTLGITGSGTYKSLGLTKRDSVGAVVGVMPDIVGELGSWVPVIDQGGVVSSTNITSEYERTGRILNLHCNVTLNADGIAGNALAIILPAELAASSAVVGTACGTAVFSSGSQSYTAVAWLASTTAIVFGVQGASGIVFGTSPSVAVGSGTQIKATFSFRK